MATPDLPSSSTRREFLKAAGAASATLAAGAPFIRAEDKAAAKAPVLGHGTHQYECIHDWGQLPADISYGNTHGVAEDSQGRIYIKHTVARTA
jgi:hypothetical protein